MTATRSGREFPLVRRPDLPPGPFAVAGLRRAGIAAVAALCRLPGGSAEVIGYDRSPDSVPKRVRRSLKAAGVQVHLGPESDPLGFVPAPRTLIKSPGIWFDDPLIEQARRSGVVVLDELELGWRLTTAPLVAVAGTNGKSTVASLAAALLAASGQAVGLAGNTTLGPPLSALDGNPDWIVCEVSSFQLEGCPALLPEIAVFTNLSPDHLVRHRTMRRYGELKRRLFIRGGSVAPLAVIDIGSRFGRALADDVEALGGEVVRTGYGRDADYEIRSARWTLRSAVVDLRTPTGSLVLPTRLPGMHNARNLAALVALGDLLGVDRGQLAQTISVQPAPPGRFELLNLGQAHALVLDGAASPAAVEQVLLAARGAIDPGGRMHVVLGVLGTPHWAHQWALGRAARGLGDQLILTAGSLRANAPLSALAGLIAGAQAGPGATLQVVPSRRDAIRTAWLAALPADVVLILGRGDLSEAVKGRDVNDRAVLQELARGQLP